MSLHVFEKYYLLTCSSLTIRGLSGLTKNHRIAAIIAGTIKSCNVIDHLNDLQQFLQVKD